MLMHLQELGRTNGVFALRAEQPAVRRVYQSASLPVGPILCRTAAHAHLGDSRAAGSLARRQRLDEAGRLFRASPKDRDTRKDAPKEGKRPRSSATPIHQFSHDDQPEGFVSSISFGKRSPSSSKQCRSDEGGLPSAAVSFTADRGVAPRPNLNEEGSPMESYGVLDLHGTSDDAGDSGDSRFILILTERG
jgi:hypothetical protein